MQIHSDNITYLSDRAIIKRRPIERIMVWALLSYVFLFSGCSNSDESSSDLTGASPGFTAVPSTPGAALMMGFNGLIEDDTADENFTLVIIPDTQYYSLDYPETYYAQANWIVQNALSENIKFVIHLGDLVQQSTSDQWEVADAAHDILDKSFIPYSVALGNHDFESDGDFHRNTEKFNQYFGVSRFSGKPFYGGGYPAWKNDNSYYFFQSGDLDFLVLSLEYAPRKDTLAWAAEIINSHPDHRVIIVTHAYLHSDADYLPKHSEVTLDYNMIGSDGTTLFNEFISRYSNIFMVVAGHNAGDGVRSIAANDGHIIYEVLIDYQAEPNGGNGWFKTMEFSPSEGTILMTSHTVAADVSSFSQTSYYSSDPEAHTYEVSYDMSSTSDFAENINPVGFNDRTMNSTGSGNQKFPKVANTISGYSIVVWEDDSNENGNYNIKMRGFTPDGAENFGEMIVNGDTRGTHINPSVAVDPSGNAVVVWQDDSDGNGYYEIKMSGYTIDGASRFSDYTVNTSADGQRVKPAVAMDSAGNFVVVWQYNTGNGSGSEIYMKGFSSTGSEYFSQTVANGASAGNRFNPDIEMLSNGAFVVAWECNKGIIAGSKIYMRGFNYSASPTEYFSETEANPEGTGLQTDPAICRLPDGRFVVAWEDDNSGRAPSEIYIRGFDSAGAQCFFQKAAEPLNFGAQYNPAIASDEDGYFAVSWQNDRFGTYDVMINAFNLSGEQIMPQTRVNKDGNGQQTDPDVSIGNDGRIVVVWSDDADNNGYRQILGRGAYDFGFEIYYGD